MPKHSVTIAELLKMSEAELRQEIRSHRSLLQQKRMAIRLSKEKDTAQYQRDRRQVACMETALTMIRTKALKPATKSSTVPAPSRK